MALLTVLDDTLFEQQQQNLATSAQHYGILTPQQCSCGYADPRQDDADVASGP